MQNLSSHMGIFMLQFYWWVRDCFAWTYQRQIISNQENTAQIELRDKPSTMITAEGKVIRGGNFHSLNWLQRKGDRWKKRASITRRQFERGHSNFRFVSKLHSFDEDAGTAIFQVGEKEPPTSAGVIHCGYSWREWDLNSNNEVRLLQKCKGPFEDYDCDANK